MSPKTAVIIPTYNEKENIQSLIGKIIDLKINSLSVIVVDDASPDGTGEIVDNLVKKYPRTLSVIHREGKLGLGSAYKSGFKKAFMMNVDVIVTMDADLSHNPVEIPKMLEKLKDFDVVVGSRHIKGGKIIGFSLWRHLLSGVAQGLCRILLGIGIYDSTSGFRAYKAEVLKSVNPYTIKSEGYSYLIEAIFRSQNGGYKITEIPILFKARKKGKSKVSQREIYKAIATVARLRYIA